ncbi:3-deoxy-7-phosphoheptulonate synthase [Rickettsiella endosymbiont of Miltochrista miniata]|uniref:3-deoxy-7-phosphoheptulonate synthase n=1 Tax=Rickettsiella endosymbiont of Miltochrista miniata TaxID=3066239 RepID=UPI00313DCEDE
MNYLQLKELPRVEEIIQLYPLSAEGHQKIMLDRREIKDILAGRDRRLLMIIGPCSAWPKDAVLEYAERLLKVNARVKQSLKIVMRVYIQKPRTTKGWTGPLNQPDPYAEPNIEAGMHYVREMMVKIVELGLPIADECLFTHNSRGFLELVSWFAIGARSSEDHEHRIFASAADCPVGMKNPTHGAIDVSINSVVAAQHSHIAAMHGYEIRTPGNPYAHLVLRGCNKMPNYSRAHLESIKQHMLAQQIKNPAVVIDVSHDNSLVNGKKDHRAQLTAISEIMQYLKMFPELRRLMKGFMLESYLKEGNQKLEACNSTSIDLNGLSITDPCLNWEQTENLLLTLAQEVQSC